MRIADLFPFHADLEISGLPGARRKARYEPVLAGPHLMGKFRRSVTF
jgi:hypothetical protein